MQHTVWRTLLAVAIAFAIACALVDANDDAAQATATSEGEHAAHEHPKPTHFEIVVFNWDHVQTPYTVALWLLLASVAKILFHVNKKFGDALPDSALLIVVGLILGYALSQIHVSQSLFTLKPDTFFLYLLPPIIFDAGYFMPNRQLFENLDSVMLFAVIGTIYNTVAIGGTLLLLGQYGMFSIDFSAFEIMLFASLISAVDPVAVIAVFEEIHVNEFLFVNVFGEALFNDGVTVVLYMMFNKFTLIGEENLQPSDYIQGGLSFFVIALGGVLIGTVFALIVSLLTKYSDRVRTVAPVFIFVVPYLSYLTAEMFGLSSILAIVACGIFMKQYVKGNITHDAASSVKYFVKMLAQSSETAIFMFLGLSVITYNHHWDTAFVLITVAICLIYRCIGVIIQCAVLNRFRKKKFTAVDQFVLSYGGLRGAIAFGLVVSLPAQIAAKPMFITTCIAVIYFTVFLQGITIRPLLHWLKVERAEERQLTMIENVYNRYFDYTMAGIEDICGQKGRNAFRDKFERFNAKVLKPVLIKEQKRTKFDASQIVRAYTKISLHEAAQVARVGSMSKVSPLARQTKSFSYGEKMQIEQNGTAVEKKVDIDQYIASQENVEALYAMFSRLLDRKLDEIRSPSPRPSQASDQHDDIKDDYMAMIRRPPSDEIPSGVRVNNERQVTQSENLHANGGPQRLSLPTNQLHRSRSSPRSAEDPC